MGNVPIAGILRLPLLLNTRADYDKAERVMRPYIEQAFADQGVVVLGHYLFPLQVAWSTKRLNGVTDFKGQKLRVTSPEQAAFVERFGGIPITLGAAEVPPALQRGTIDGVFTASAGGGKIWGDMLKYNHRLGVNYFNVVYIANKAAFDKLSPQSQRAVREIVARLAPSTTDLIASEEDTVTEQLRKAGMTVTEPGAAEIQTAIGTIKPYWDEWATSRGPQAVEALAKVRQALGR
jgi:TRAP-type C4-dicarboxylate transport system substrate-binding protein